MAAVGSLDLPDLPRLFAGEERILSWKDVPVHNWDTGNFDDDELAYWKQVLNVERVSSYLKSNVPLFEPRSGTSAKRVESATAAINVPPTKDQHYDVQEIKTDAKWLADAVTVNEVEALRVCLLEWQSRPQLHLQAGYSDAEIASLKDNYGPRLAFAAEFESNVLCKRDDKLFREEQARRIRQLTIYFQECAGLARTWLALRDGQLGLLPNPPDIDSEASIADLEQCMRRLTQQLRDLADPSAWPGVAQSASDIYCAGSLRFSEQLMQIVIVELRKLNNCPFSVVQDWFTTMRELDFLSAMEPQSWLSEAQLGAFNHLIILVGVALVNCGIAIEQLQSERGQHWVSESVVVTHVFETLLNAVQTSCPQAMLVAFAFGLVLQVVENHMDGSEGSHPSAVDNEAHDTLSARRASPAASGSDRSFLEIHRRTKDQPDELHSARFLLEQTFVVNRVADQLAVIAQSYSPALLTATQIAQSGFLQELLICATQYLPTSLAYSEDILTMQSAILEPPKSIHLTGLEFVDAANDFLRTETPEEAIFNQASQWFPHEALPFLTLCRQLARADAIQENTHYITFRLRKLQYFTALAVGSLAEYHTTREDENLNYVALNKHAYAFPQGSTALLTSNLNNKEVLVIEAGTEGVVVSDHEPRIIRWNYEYSGFALIGEWLELHYNGLLQEVVSGVDTAQEIVSEMITLLANLLTTTYLGIDDPEQRDASVDIILIEATAHLANGSNVAELVFNIIEQEIQAYRRRPTNTFDTSILVACMTFARAVLKIRPSQFWSQITKTNIISTHGGSGLLYMLISGVESMSGDASVTLATAHLYQDMILATMRQTTEFPVMKRWRSKSSQRPFNSLEKSYEMSLSSLTQTMLEVLEAMTQWQKLAEPQEPQIITIIANSFGELLRIRFGVGSQMSTLTASLSSAANAILNRLRPSRAGDARSGPIISHIIFALNLNVRIDADPAMLVCYEALLDLSNALVRVGLKQMQPAAGFETCLFDLVPILVRQLNPLSRMQSSSQLLQSLLEVLSQQKPVSLLGHLGTESSIDLVDVILGGQHGSYVSVATDRWMLLELLIRREQQWFSIVLLTGSIPHKDSNIASADGNVYRGRLVLNRAVDIVEHLQPGSENAHELPTAVVRFIITAQQNWSWTLTSLRSKQTVLKRLVDCATSSVERQTNTDADWLQISALITDFCSVYLQYAKSVQDSDLVTGLVPLLNWLTIHAVDVRSYNASLHANLRKNFSAKFNLELDDFKSNRLFPEQVNDFVDLDLAELVLGHDPAWKPQGTKAANVDQSYYAEIARANTNLRLVEAEIQLLQSFKRVCIEHASFLIRMGQAQHSTMVDVARRCLAANATKQPAEEIFDHLKRARNEMSLALMQQLAQNKIHSVGARELLGLAWQNTVFSYANYEEAIANDDLDSWRTNLRIVLLALQFHIGKAWQPLASTNLNPKELLKHSNSITPEILEIATVVIGQGLSTVVTTIQEQKQAEMQHQPTVKSNVGFSDLTTILGLLETLLRLPGLPEFATQLAERLIATGAIQTVSKLFSWAHLLVNRTDSEPLHAAVALNFLVLLSSLPPLAGEMAIEGVLSSILTARVTQVLQNVSGGVGPLDTRPHCSMLYSIWTEVLALTLNLLHAVGGTLAAEISSFLNQFPEQLNRAAISLRPQEGAFITIAQAREISTLSLLSYLLQDFHNAGASAAVDPNQVQLLKVFDENRRAISGDIREHLDLGDGLKDKVVPTDERELHWHKDGVLVSKVRSELEMAVACLNDVQNEVIDEPRPRSTSPELERGSFGR